jgi:uncharacterized protein (UPF0335 family)
LTLNEWLTHIEWLLASLAGAIVTAATIVWRMGGSIRRDLGEKIGRVEDDYKAADADLKEADKELSRDLDGVTRQVSAFQAEMFSRDDGNKLEDKFIARVNRMEDSLIRQIQDAVKEIRK